MTKQGTQTTDKPNERYEVWCAACSLSREMHSVERILDLHTEHLETYGFPHVIEFEKIE